MKRRALFALAAALALAGCAGPAPPQRLYALRSTPPVPTPAPAAGGEVWELSPTVRLPGALDRDTLMVESGAAGLQPLAGHRWAEPLRDSVPRLLLHDLMQQRGSGRVWAAPAPPGVVVARRLRLELLALHADADRRRLHLQARWWLEDAAVAATAPPQTGEAHFSVDVADASVDALAAAHRVALWRLAERIAAPRREAAR